MNKQTGTVCVCVHFEIALTVSIIFNKVISKQCVYFACHHFDERLNVKQLENGIQSPNKLFSYIHCVDDNTNDKL